MNHRALASLCCLLLICATCFANPAPNKPDPAATLGTKYASLQAQLRHNQFGQPLVLNSDETPERLMGDIYAIVDYPFDAANASLNSPDHWCDVMLLHINSKYCHAVAGSSGTVLIIHIGKKTPEELADAPRIELDYNAVATTPGYFSVLLNAEHGPLGTSDFRIRLEAAALPNAKTFLHLTYSYATNFAARMAMQAYLGTIGSDKVGFTVTGKQADGQPAYIEDVRGLMERNTMRYYLAIDSFLGVASAKQFEKRLQRWFTATERYPRQLHEMDQGEYLEMKRAEYARQRTVH